MKDLCFFLGPRRSRNFTVHLESRRQTPWYGRGTTGECDGVDRQVSVRTPPPITNETLLLHGIRNFTLHSLGIVLLQTYGHGAQ